MVKTQGNNIVSINCNLLYKAMQAGDTLCLAAFISALTKQRILKAVETAMMVYEDRKKRIKTSKLNETLYNKFGHEFVLVDTAGMRRKSKVSEDLEFYSVMRSIRAIEHSDVVIIMVDATLGWESQDMNIFSLAQK